MRIYTHTIDRGGWKSEGWGGGWGKSGRTAILGTELTCTSLHIGNDIIYVNAYKQMFFFKLLNFVHLCCP